MTHTQAKKLQYLIRKLVRATVNESWKGALPPEEHEALELATRRARIRLNGFIITLQKEATHG